MQLVQWIHESSCGDLQLCQICCDTQVYFRSLSLDPVVHSVASLGFQAESCGFNPHAR